MKRRGKCAHCGRECGLTEDGRVRAHGWTALNFGQWCAGSRELPLGEVVR